MRKFSYLICTSFWVSASFHSLPKNILKAFIINQLLRHLICSYLKYSQLFIYFLGFPISLYPHAYIFLSGFFLLSLRFITLIIKLLTHLICSFLKYPHLCFIPLDSPNSFRLSSPASQKSKSKTVTISYRYLPIRCCSSYIHMLILRLDSLLFRFPPQITR